MAPSATEIANKVSSPHQSPSIATKQKGRLNALRSLDHDSKSN